MKEFDWFGRERLIPELQTKLSALVVMFACGVGLAVGRQPSKLI
jgi:hypothetical protein